jgi:DNA polymerase-3 subunit delta'
MSEQVSEKTPVHFPELIGQERIHTILSRAVTGGRLPHAYLFLGPEGSGREAAAIGLARALLCRSAHEQRGTEPRELPCEHCDSCAQSRKLTHPGLSLLYPLPKPKESASDEVGEQSYTDNQQKQIVELIAAKAEDLYIPLNIPGAQEILIEHIRSLRREFRLTSYSGGWRIVIISQADKLRIEAANAFLKLLEEPPKNVMFILTSTRESRLLPTIISRCQILRFPPLSEEEIAKELAGRLNVDADKAHSAARLAGGSWREAVRWAKEDPAGEMAKAVDLLRQLVKGDPGTLDVLADNTAQSSAGEFDNLLVLLSKWIRDVQRYASDPERHQELSRDEALVRFAGFTAGRDHAAAIEEVNTARLDLQRNVQPALVAHNLFTSLWRTLFSKSSATV